MKTLNSVKKVINAFYRRAKRRGFTKTLKYSLKKASGINGMEEEINTLFYLLNQYVDITQLPPAKGALRKMQLCDTVVLSIFDAICRKQNWKYALCQGTLLGAVRHKGFIPWDDDMDVYMPRKDYDEAKKKLPEIFASYGDDTLNVWGYDAVNTIGYKHGRTGIMLDMFPFDIVRSESDDEAESIKRIMAKMDEYQKYYYAHKNKIGYEALSEARSNILGTIALEDLSIGGGVCSFSS